MTKSTGVGRGSNPASWGNGKSGPAHPRWNDERMLSEHGYVKVRVGKEHPLGDANGYAYEHLLVWVSAGNEMPDAEHILHHKNETKTDNRLSNLEILDRTEHAFEHYGEAMLSDAQVRDLRCRYEAGEKGTDLAEQFGIPMQRAYKIIKGVTRASAGGPIQKGSLRGRNRS